jgi:hypothetical protein
MKMQDDEIFGMHYGFFGVHLEIFECAGELVVCCQLVVDWRDDCDFAS